MEEVAKNVKRHQQNTLSINFKCFPASTSGIQEIVFELNQMQRCEQHVCVCVLQGGGRSLLKNIFFA